MLKQNLEIMIVGAFALLFAELASAAVKISQAGAEAGLGGCDAPGFPVTICEAGFYRLTTNLDITDPVWFNVSAIEVTADHVKISLGGYAIIGTKVPSLAGKGIVSGSNSFTTVTNGSVIGMGNNGIDLYENAHVQNVRVQDTAGQPVVVRGNSRVQNCIIDLRGADGNPLGISLVGEGFVVEGNVILGAGQQGIGGFPGSEALVRRNVVKDSGTGFLGIDVGPNSLVIDNIVQ